LKNFRNAVETGYFAPDGEQGPDENQEEVQILNAISPILFRILLPKKTLNSAV
jgi:hypothetical protein